MPDRKAFLSLLGKHLYPFLRAEGFKGSGATLRRVNGKVVHVFNVQGSRGGHECYLNLGAHLTFLPPEGGLPVDIVKFEEPDCAFRGRIEPPAGEAFGWSYGRDRDEALEIVEFIVSEWRCVGCAFFQKYENFPESFLKLVTRTPPDTLHPRDCLHYARIAQELGLPEMTVQFARSGLLRAREQATLLRADLQQVIAQCEQFPISNQK